MCSHRMEFERKLLNNYKSISIFDPQKHHPIIEKYKNGSFGISSCAFALYSNGYNPRGFSTLAPCGLFYHDGDRLFSIGHYEKEGEEGKGSYLMITAPTGKDAVRAAGDFAKQVLSNTSLQCKGAYIRFLAHDSLPILKEIGFKAVDEKTHPWHAEAPLEDETYSSSTIHLPGLIEPKTDYAKRAKNRFTNFLERNKLTFEWSQMLPEDFITAEGIIRTHFDALEAMGKKIGSTAEDYFGFRHTISIGCIDAKIGYISNVPVSAFISEPINPEKSMAGIYCSITLRYAKDVLPALGLDPEEKIPNIGRLIKQGLEPEVPRKEGFTAMPIFCHIKYAESLLQAGFSWAKLGGSETKDLDDAKKKLGALPDKTYWMALMK